jgi:hypothetical protein
LFMHTYWAKMHKQLCNRYIVDPSTRQTDLSERNEFRSFVFKTGKMAILTWLNYFIGVNAGAPNGISSSCSTCGACWVTLVTNPMVRPEWGKDRIVEHVCGHVWDRYAKSWWWP